MNIYENCDLQKQPSRGVFKGELHFNYIFLYFVLIGLEWDSTNLFTKMNFLFLPKLTFQHPFTQDIYMTFCLLTWTYFNDVNQGRNILINSELKESFLWAGTRKMKQNWGRQKKHGKKKITAMKVRL